MSIGDLKPVHAPAADGPPWNLCAGLLFVIALLTVYGFVADTPERQVVARTVTLTEDELRQIVEAHRIDAARQAMDAQRCDRLQDQFKWTPKRERVPM